MTKIRNSFSALVTNVSSKISKTRKAKAADSGKEKVRLGVKKMSRALPKNTLEAVDSVRVRIQEVEEYLQEIATGKQIHHGAEFRMLRASRGDLDLHHRIKYDAKDKNLKSYSQKDHVVDTSRGISKGAQGFQAFVMSTKEGILYIGTHAGELSLDDYTLTHASFLGGKPAEMAGMIKIEHGKITSITDESGHYIPEALDMYRGIKKLQQNMPDVFAPDAKIKLYNKDTMMVSDFINNMEKLENGKPHHWHLREERIATKHSFDKKLKDDANTFVVNRPFAEASEFFKTINAKQMDGMSHVLASDGKLKFIHSGEHISYSINDTINTVVKEGDTKAVLNLTKILMESSNPKMINIFSTTLKRSPIVKNDDMMNQIHAIMPPEAMEYGVHINTAPPEMKRDLAPEARKQVQYDNDLLQLVSKSIELGQGKRIKKILDATLRSNRMTDESFQDKLIDTIFATKDPIYLKWAIHAIGTSIAKSTAPEVKENLAEKLTLKLSSDSLFKEASVIFQVALHPELQNTLSSQATTKQSSHTVSWKTIKPQDFRKL